MTDQYGNRIVLSIYGKPLDWDDMVAFNTEFRETYDNNDGGEPLPNVMLVHLIYTCIHWAT